MIRYIRNINPERFRETALVRIDLNIEDDPNSDADDWRLEAAIPTLKLLKRISEKILIISHYGRPGGSGESRVSISGGVPDGPGVRKYSLKKNVAVLERFLKRKVSFIPHFRFDAVRDEIRDAPSRSIFLLENIRFMEGEAKNDVGLGKDLASLGDFYVNEAFANCHRKHASMVSLAKNLPAYGGIELEKEVRTLSHVMNRARKPLVVIVGGAKAKSKLDLLRYFRTKADAILLGGGSANTLLNIKGIDVGRSLYEKDISDVAELKKLIKRKNVILPSDWRMENDMILDIGSETEKAFVERIEEARTIIWSGPLGLIEKKRFEKGTLSVAEAITKNKKAFSLTGGGETVLFLRQHGLDGKLSFISTGGGAMVEFLSGKKLPALEVLGY